MRGVAALAVPMLRPPGCPLGLGSERGVALRILLGTLDDPLNSNEVRSLLQHPNVPGLLGVPAA